MKRSPPPDEPDAKRTASSGLTLASDHALSLELAATDLLQAAVDVDRRCKWEPGSLEIAVSCRAAGSGLVDVTLRAGELEGYGASSWTIRIGGVGLGDEPELAAVLGTPARAPIAV